MRSITERRYLNGKKWTKEERVAAERSVAFLKAKYRTSRYFFALVWKLKLTYRPLREPFVISYLADKLTQQVTFGKYYPNSPERGSWGIDPNSVCDCPAWFSESLQVDKH